MARGRARQEARCGRVARAGGYPAGIWKLPFRSGGPDFGRAGRRGQAHARLQPGSRACDRRADRVTAAARRTCYLAAVGSEGGCADLRRRARSSIYRQDPRHPEREGRTRDVLFDRTQRSEFAGSGPPDVRGRSRYRQPYVFASERFRHRYGPARDGIERNATHPTGDSRLSDELASNALRRPSFRIHGRGAAGDPGGNTARLCDRWHGRGILRLLRGQRGMDHPQRQA